MAVLLYVSRDANAARRRLSTWRCTKKTSRAAVGRRPPDEKSTAITGTSSRSAAKPGAAACRCEHYEPGIDTALNEVGMEYPGLPARKRVLIVDDSDDVRDMWHDWLIIWGFDVDVAENGAEAVRKAAARPPDLVLMDWTMPVLDGLHATELLKADAATAKVPVLALSADTFAPTPQEALSAGCASFLGKPVTPESLLNEIRRAFRQDTRRTP
jgi:CheY-like chemotaxis protein